MASVYDRSGSVISEIDMCCPQHSYLIELFKTAGPWSHCSYLMFFVRRPEQQLFSNNEYEVIERLISKN